MIRKGFTLLLSLMLSLLFAFLSANAGVNPSSGAGAVQTVEKLHSALLEAMKDADKLGFEGRYKMLEPFIRSAFDLSHVVRIAVGRHWRGLRKEEQNLLADTFSELTVSTYASRFGDFSGESFRTISEEPQKRGRMLVRTKLIKGNGETVSLDYLLQRSGRSENWRIINVIADGVSDLSLKRAQYTSIINREGSQALISKMREKIKDYAEPSH